mmetsp:Transcript_11589/g.17304  ORF Transcript_11589/g.17304 Transcript_11589/m.17304 type:complete len:686 (-) Transcript_11589:65-2122(-)
MAFKLRLLFSVALLLPNQIKSHPQCLDFSAPLVSNQYELTFCTHVESADNPDGSCCDAARDSEIQSAVEALNLSDECLSYHTQVACGECEPYALHLMGESTPPSLLICPTFCQSYYDACVDELDLPSDYCTLHSSNSYYCYPFEEPEFPVSAELVPYFNRISLPLQMVGMYKRPDYNAWWILSQDGIITQILNDPETTFKTVVLDLSSEAGSVYPDVEVGLLGLAFRPDFQTSRIFYVNYVTPDLETRISMFTYVIGGAATTLSSEKIVLSFQQPWKNHNGGTILFPPADMADPFKSSYELFITSGDGGDMNDPDGNAQNIDSYFGKILRINVLVNYPENGPYYSTPSDNLKGLVYAYGLRNPWRCTFDKIKLTDPDLWCADVGQEKMEEINIIQKGADHGWNHHEGSLCNVDTTSCDPFVGTVGKLPEFEFCHTFDTDDICTSVPFTGLSVTGGYVYRGSKYPQFYGNYVFSDYMSPSQLYKIEYDSVEGKWKGAVILGPGSMVRATAFAEDPDDGELYIVAYNKDGTENIYLFPCGDLCLKEEETTSAPVTSSVTSDPTCSTGIIHPDGVSCCSGSCENCGGAYCGSSTGGAASCCSSAISVSGKSCADNMPPCIITDANGSDPTCSTGKIHSDGITCCNGSCERCGGSNCWTSAGGASNCCSSSISTSGRYCDEVGPPCIMT